MSDVKMPTRVMFGIQQPSYVRPEIAEVKQSGGYQSFGRDNKYPDYLINIYFGSSQHQGIIQRKVDEILGNGLNSVTNNEALLAFIKKCNDKNQSLNTVLRKCVTDNEIIGGFALQIVYGKGSAKGKPIIAGVFNVDISKLRWNVDYTKLKYARDWNNGRVKTITYDVYDPENPVGTQVFYYSGTMTRGWYPVPQYVGSIPAIETSIEIANFNLNTLRNGFFPSLAITFNDGEPTEEEKGYIQNAIDDKWGGTNNAGRIMLFFGDKDGKGVQIDPIAQPDLDKRFSELKLSVIQDIFIGHRITNPAMFGLEVAGKLGGAGEYTQAYAIFQQVFVKPQRKILMDLFNNIFDPIMSGCDLEVLATEPIKDVFKDDALIASQMTQSELRKLFKEWGYVDTVELPEGEVTIVDQLPNNEDSQPGGAAVAPTVADPNDPRAEPKPAAGGTPPKPLFPATPPKIHI